MTLRRAGGPAWFPDAQSAPGAKLRLFCFPYAGAGASVFKGWANCLPPGVEVWPAHLPGRGGRFGEAPHVTLDSLLDDLVGAIRPLLGLPFSFFGHSLGALISFELTRRLREEFGVAPGCLFVSGARGPHLPRTYHDIHRLSDKKFVAEVRGIKGTPAEVLDNPELMSTVMKPLRADFALAETYRYKARPPLSCPITAFGGSDDRLVPQPDLEAWSAQTAGAFGLWMLPGDHFFLHDSDWLLLQVLSQETRRLLNFAG